MKTGVLGRVASLHLHPGVRGEPLSAVECIQVEAGKGILGNPRYYARRSRSGGFSRRQVSLIEREQIAAHAAVFGLQKIAPGVIRSNIETTGVNLCEWIGAEMRIGEAALYFYEARTPCEKMDAICIGLRAAMENKRQGVLAQVIQSGKIEVGDEISLVKWIEANQERNGT